MTETATRTTTSEELAVAGSYEVVKSDDEAQLIFGWASVSVHRDGTEEVDAHGDVIPIDVLEGAAYDFVLTSRASGEDHDEDAGITGHLVESMVFTDEKLEALATDGDGRIDRRARKALQSNLPRGMWVGFHIADREAFEAAKSGDKPMFSIEGTALVEEVDG